MLKRYFSNLWDYNKSLRQKHILEVATSLKGKIKTYLDLGCDNGVVTLEIGKACSADNIFGVEINTPRAKMAEGKGVNVSTTNLNRKFPFNDNFFDLVTADQVIEHLVDVDNFVLEIKRILKPNGTAVVVTENLASFHNIAALLIGEQPFTGPNISLKFPIGYHPLAPKDSSENIYNTSLEEMEDHKRVMTFKALVNLFKAYKFQIVEKKGFGYIPFPSLVGKLFGNLDKNHSQFISVVVKKTNA